MISPRCALARLSESLLFVLLLVMVTVARPAVDFEITRPLLEQPQQAHNELHLRTHTHVAHDAHDTYLGSVDSAFRKRMMPGVTPVLPAVSSIKMNQLHFTKLGVALLSASNDLTEAMRETSQKLQNFYMDIAYKAQDEWTSLPEMNYFFLDDESGQVRLSFKSIGDNIPWSFVKEMAERLWQCATLGLANLFEVVYSDQTATIGVRVTLDLVTSSSGSESGTREGSVPSVTSPKGKG